MQNFNSKKLLVIVLFILVVVLNKIAHLGLSPDDINNLTIGITGYLGIQGAIDWKRLQSATSDVVDSVENSAK